MCLRHTKQLVYKYHICFLEHAVFVTTSPSVHLILYSLYLIYLNIFI